MGDTKNIPLSGFDPRFRELLLRGTFERFEIPCGTERRAHRLQSQLCTFRSRSKKERFEEKEAWEPLYGTVVSKKGDDSSTLVLYPRVSEFDDVLNTVSGTALPTLKSDPLEELEND